MRRKINQPMGPEVLAGEGIVIVDSQFRPIALDSGAKAILHVAYGNSANVSEEGATLPQDLLETLTARSLGQLASSVMSVQAGGQSYSCRSFAITPLAGVFAEPVLALYLKREVSVVDAVHHVGVEYSLTDREQEALIGVAMGLTSKELAVRMKISPNTVKAFLRLIMVKMGTTTRAGIVGRLLESDRSTSAGGSR